MENPKLLLLLLLFFNLGRAQSIDTLEYDDEEDYTVQLGFCPYKSYKVDYVASLDSNSIIGSTVLSTNLVTNLELLDSINMYRIKNDVDAINEGAEVDDRNMFYFIEQISVDLSNTDSNDLVLKKFEIYKACECASSIYNIIMDSTLIFGKKQLREILGSKRVKWIDVVYGQIVLQRPNPHYVEYLYLRVYRKFGLFPRIYTVDLTSPEEETKKN